MKQRLFNTFIKIVKIRIIAKILSEIAYSLLLVFYCFKRLFARSISNVEPREARLLLNDYSKKPQMETEYSYYDKSLDLSIIVPAYNAEKTIEDCVKSVINQQTSIDYELLIINDGSTDNTQEIIERIKDSHVRVINQNNRGFSGARNRGIDESKGIYLMFLDSDDLLVGDCIESLMKKIRKSDSDIIQGSYYSFDDHHKNVSLLKDEVITDNRKMHQPGYPWAKIYKSSLFKRLRFPLDVWFEDTIVCMLLYRLCKKMEATDEVVYAWRLNPNGITSNVRNNKKSIDHYWVMEYCLEKSMEFGLPNDENQYELVKGHLSTLMFRRLSLQNKEVLESAFVLGCEMLDSIRPKAYECDGTLVERDLEKAFRTKNYKLWKLASFVV